MRGRHLVVLVFICCLSQAGMSFAGEESLVCRLSEREVVLESGETTFTVSALNKEEIIKIKDSAGVLCYYRLMSEPEEKFVISGRHLESCSLLKDDEEEKMVKIIFSPEPTLQLELILSIKKGYPCLFIKAFLWNISSRPLSTGFEWFGNVRFKKYLAVNNQIFEIPDKIAGTDMTMGLMGKVNWQSIGISPYDKWLYLLPEKDIKKGLGIVIKTESDKETTFFGIRGDRLVYWGEKRCLLEEGDKTTFNFILIPVKSCSKFIKILKEVWEGGNHGTDK